MENKVAIEKLERQSKLICHGCMHPSMVGWCENHCQLPEAFKMAISALEKQEVNKCCETCKHKHLDVDASPCCDCIRAKDHYIPYTEEEA